MKIKLLAATALVAATFSPALTSPAFAVVPADIQADMQDVCDATLIPNNASDFTAEVIGVTEATGSEFVQSSHLVSSTPGGVLLSQTSAFNGGSEHRHGGSPNIFGTFTVTSTYTGGSSVTEVTYAQTTTYTFGCHVFKVEGNSDHPHVVEPGPFQTPIGLTVENTVVTHTDTVNVNNPNTVTTSQGDGVICNSPTKNPGTWRNQNGYGGTCSTALFNSVGLGEPISSNSLPPA